MYSVTQNICAALHLGRLIPQEVIDRLEDRHRANLPEFGIDKATVLLEAKCARVRDEIFDLILLIPAFWIVLTILNFDFHNTDSFLLRAILTFSPPIFLAALIETIKVLVINNHLRRKVARSITHAEQPEDGSSVHNVIIFGGFSPFAGYGVDLDGWSFVIDSEKPKNDDDRTHQFEQIELLNCVSEVIRKTLISATITDKIFVDGRRIRSNRMLLPAITASPKVWIDPDVIRAKIGQPDQEALHYRVISIQLADEQMLLTYFLRSTMLGSNLFIESRCFLLPPIKPEFAELVNLPCWHGPQYYCRVYAQKLLGSLLILLGGSIFLLGIVRRSRIWLSERIFGHPEDKRKVRDESYNYGNPKSLRESWGAENWNAYFQMLEKDMAAKTCQYVIVNSIVDFLDAKGIATDDIKERRTQIFNSGLIISGGTVTAEQVAVGSGASVKTKITVPQSAESDGGQHGQRRHHS
ncbi:hypothetical protein LMG28614_06001 [Paraburkholderia ultramafica]|uniref:Uncharacterized protein n=1 Tax=Paraburkholderia ultramafica TaxID=1544867 RepID=A0A6S7DFU3_9BURK|nr:hypothetical protein [Paraburkholderia ultramafica]CAB3804292.1 hypothetical protein LMG28614_06001 [Paraburkholderia ultramafica]